MGTFRKLSVVHIGGSGTVGGLERNLYLLIREQMKDPYLNVGVILGCAGGYYYQKIKELGCNILVAGVSKGFDLSKTLLITRFLKKFDIHHFHTSTIPCMIASVIIPDKCRIVTYRGGLRYHRYNFHGLKEEIRQIFMSWFLKYFFSGFTGNSKHAAMIASKKYCIPFRKFYVTYNGVDFVHLKPRRSRNAMRKFLGLSKYFVIGTSSILKDWKRLDRLLRVTSRLDGRTFRLLIVGDGPEKNNLVSLSKKLKIEDRVVFTGLQHSVADFLNAMDIFVLPSDGHESFGNAVVEAMGSGIPSIVFSDGGGAPEHIIHNKTGLIVNHEKELENCVEYLMKKPKLRKEIGQAGRRYVRSHYKLSQQAVKYKEIYMEFNN